MVKQILTTLIFFSINTVGYCGINIWTQANQTQGYDIYSIVIDTTTTGRIYAGTNGVLKTINYGTSWTYSDYPPDLGAEDIAIDPTNPNIVYAGIGANIGPYKSIDQGSTWVGISSDLGSAGVSSLLIDPRDISKMYAGGPIGSAPFFASTDTGYHWHTSYTGITSSGGVVYKVIRHPQNPDTFYAVTGGQPAFYVTYDSASIWQSKFTPFGASRSLAMDPTNSNILYVGLFGGGIGESGGEIWKTQVAGESWYKLTGYPIVNPARDLLVNPENHDIVYAATYGAGVWKTKNGGLTWSVMTNGLSHRYIYALAYDSTNHTLYAGTVINSGFDTPHGLWMYTDTDLTSYFPVAVEEKYWQLFE